MSRSFMRSNGKQKLWAPICLIRQGKEMNAQGVQICLLEMINSKPMSFNVISSLLQWHPSPAFCWRNALIITPCPSSFTKAPVHNHQRSVQSHQRCHSAHPLSFFFYFALGAVPWLEEIMRIITHHILVPSSSLTSPVHSSQTRRGWKRGEIMAVWSLCPRGYKRTSCILSCHFHFPQRRSRLITLLSPLFTLFPCPANP